MADQLIVSPVRFWAVALTVMVAGVTTVVGGFATEKTSAVAVRVMRLSLAPLMTPPASMIGFWLASYSAKPVPYRRRPLLLSRIQPLNAPPTGG